MTGRFGSKNSLIDHLNEGDIEMDRIEANCKKSGRMIVEVVTTTAAEKH